MREATLADRAMVEGWVKRDLGEVSDFSGFFAQPLNVCLVEGDGGAFFAWHGPGIYEVHVAFEQRGKEVIELSHRMLAHMREHYQARLFWAAVPWDQSKQGRKVRLFTRLMGWESQGHADLPHGRCELFIGE